MTHSAHAPSRRSRIALAERSARALAKGQQTKSAIVDAALRIAAQVGLEGLSIGALAEAMQMSKSGVFAHFGSRDELQISVVREYYTRFEAEVFHAAMEEKRGLPRVRALFENWMRYTSAELVNLMVGRELGEHIDLGRRAIGAPLLKVDKLCRGDKVRDVSLQVRAGEIFGISGLIGAGRTSLSGVWAGGDCVAGGADLTVTAVAGGRDAAMDIDAALRA